LLIRNVYPGSWIPEPNFFHTASRNLDSHFFHPESLIRDPGSRMRIKEFKYFNQKKWFHTSQKYDPGFHSRIRITDLHPDFYLSRIPILDPRSQIQESKRHGIPDPDFGFAQAVGGGVSY
jgi:hypothetical protein